MASMPRTVRAGYVRGAGLVVDPKNEEGKLLPVDGPLPLSIARCNFNRDSRQKLTSDQPVERTVI
jgi:hypothetical protein